MSDDPILEYICTHPNPECVSVHLFRMLLISLLLLGEKASFDLSDVLRWSNKVCLREKCPFAKRRSLAEIRIGSAPRRS